MKTTVVPAQITTVEDKIAGNLSFTQLLLLTIPVFLDGAMFVLLPPLFKLTALKLTISIIFALVCLTLAIRIRGKIIMVWLVVVIRYNLRARYYTFNKNDSHLRTTTAEPEEVEATESQVNEGLITEPALLIPMPERVRLETAVADPRAKFHFKATKGGLRVYINEVKEESL